jgi:hypothetical protein
MNHPMIYCNGDSYSNENYHDDLVGKAYANFVAEQCSGFVINKSINGSCNRRIIRTTVHDMILQRQLNPSQKIIALIGLSFEIRSELWLDNLSNNVLEEESNFRSHRFTEQVDWRENLLAGKDIQSPDSNKQNNVFLKKFSEGRAYFFSPYAERINLLCDLLMLRTLLDSLNIDFLIFQSPQAEMLQEEYLLDFFKKQIADDNRFFDLETFGFCDWCNDQKFTPLDYLDRPRIGHYGADAHQAFAEQVLIPRLKELNIL